MNDFKFMIGRDGGRRRRRVGRGLIPQNPAIARMARGFFPTQLESEMISNRRNPSNEAGNLSLFPWFPAVNPMNRAYFIKKILVIPQYLANALRKPWQSREIPSHPVFRQKSY